MSKEVDPSYWEFAKYALQRNDEAIRFSETKAALLLTLTGLVLAIIVDKVPLYRSLFQSQSCTIKILTISSLVAIILGILLVGSVTLLAIFPRLHISKDTSYLYFEHLSKISEQEIADQFTSLDSTTKLRHILSQIHATSVIANLKFKLIRLALVGTVLEVLGSILTILALLIT